MAASDPFDGGAGVRPRDLGSLVLPKSVNHFVAASAGDAVVLESPDPAEDTVLWVQVVAGEFRFRPGKYDGFQFVAGDVTAAADTIDETGHGYVTGEGPIQLTTSAADLPDGLAVATDYFVIRVDADTIALATSQANAVAGVRVDIVDGGSGTHEFGTPETWGGDVSAPAATLADGYGSIVIGAGVTRDFRAPRRLTASATGAGSLSYWWAR